MKRFELKRRLSLNASLLTMTIFCSVSILINIANADNMNAGVYSKEDKPFGISYGEWLAKWNQWFINFPNENNTRDQYTPELCSVGQNGPVWFLADILNGKDNRSCTIPADKAILLPVVSGSGWDDKTDPKQATLSGLLESAQQNNNASPTQEINIQVFSRRKGNCQFKEL